MWTEEGYQCIWLWSYMIMKSEWSFTQKLPLFSTPLLFLQDEIGPQALCWVFLFSTYGSGATSSLGRIRRWGSCCMIESGRRDHFSVLRRHGARLHRQQVTDHMAQKERYWKHTPHRLALVSLCLCPYDDLFLLLFCSHVFVREMFASRIWFVLCHVTPCLLVTSPSHMYTLIHWQLAYNRCLVVFKTPWRCGSE